VSLKLHSDGFEQFFSYSRMQFNGICNSYHVESPVRKRQKKCFIFVNMNMNSVYTGYLQKNGAVLKFNKKSVSQLERVKRTPPAATTV
jgi:hypothetical protein